MYLTVRDTIGIKLHEKMRNETRNIEITSSLKRKSLKIQILKF